jgi:predicted nucleic acid-binding protein
MIWFLDASALVKRYVREPGSDVVRGLVRRRRRLAAAAVSLVEVPAALWRRARAGDVTAEQARRLAAKVATDLAEVELVEARGPILALAAQLVETHPLRAYDAIQLAAALRLSRETGIALTFACSDKTLLDVAKAEGVRPLRVG